MRSRRITQRHRTTSLPAPTAQLVIDGLVARRSQLSHRDLRSLVVPLAPGLHGISLVDLMSAARLSADADLLIASATGRRPQAIPMSAALDARSSIIVHGPRTALHVPGWIDADDLFGVRHLEATLFSGLISGAGREP